MNSLFAPALAALMPLALLALLAVAGWTASLLGRYLKDRRYALAVELLALGAAATVADLAQTVANDLKDPSKPGTWNAVTAASLKLKAIAIMRRLNPNAVLTIARVLRDPARVDELLGGLVERAVVDAKRPAARASTNTIVVGGSAADPGAVAAAVTSALDAPLRATRPGDPQAGRVEVSTLVVASGVLLGMIVLGAFLWGCPNWQRPSCPTPGIYSCVRDQPHYCAPSKELTPLGDEPCGAQRRACAIDDGGVAWCAPVVDAGTDGGR